jgi:dihydrofolate reductase
VIDGIESAIAQAKAAAGDKDVTIVGGVSTFQQCLDAGLADEIHIDIMPVLLREGLPLFAHSDKPPTNLEKIQVVDLPSGRIQMKFRVNKQ